ncbi:MAG TPA: hypothetical protein VD994_10580 [Prosthecobacter sp.]|nr:hypothetical protein [Prosthecobacter sp.]
MAKDSKRRPRLSVDFTDEEIDVLTMVSVKRRKPGEKVSAAQTVQTEIRALMPKLRKEAGGLLK